MPNLCTLANLKSYLGITSTSEDTELTRKIAAVSEEFLNEIRRPDFYPSADYTERICGNGKCEIFLKHWPINSITSVTIDGDELEEWDPNDDESTGWWFDNKAAGVAPEDRQMLRLVGWIFTHSRSSFPNIVIVYNAGYAETADSTKDSLPVSVSQAVIEWIAFKRGLGQIQATDQASSSVTMGDYSEGGIAGDSVRYQELDKPESVQCVIDQYRRATL